MALQDKENIGIPARFDFTNPLFLEALRKEAAGEETDSDISLEELEMRIYANKCVAAYYKALLDEN